MILRLLRATSEELGASAITYHQESFRTILILFPPFRESRDCHITFRLHLPLVTLGVLFSFIICDRLCENRTCRGINKNAVYQKIGGKRKFMDLLIMNSPVSLGIVLSIR